MFEMALDVLAICERRRKTQRLPYAYTLTVNRQHNKLLNFTELNTTQITFYYTSAIKCYR